METHQHCGPQLVGSRLLKLHRQQLLVLNSNEHSLQGSSVCSGRDQARAPCSVGLAQSQQPTATNMRLQQLPVSFGPLDQQSVEPEFTLSKCLRQGWRASTGLGRWI